MAIFCKFGLHWLDSYNPINAGHPKTPGNAYILLNTALYSVLYTRVSHFIKEKHQM